MTERIPITFTKPEAGETKEEFAKRFAREVMAGLEPYRTKPAAGPTGPQEPAE